MSSPHLHAKHTCLTMATWRTNFTSLLHVQGRWWSKTHPASTIAHPGSGLQSHVPLLPVAIILQISGWILVFFLNLTLPQLLENFKQLSSPCRIKSKPSQQNLPIAEINTFTTFHRTFLVLLSHFPSLCPPAQKLFPASRTLVTSFLPMKCSSLNNQFKYHLFQGSSWILV